MKKETTIRIEDKNFIFSTKKEAKIELERIQLIRRQRQNLRLSNRDLLTEKLSISLQLQIYKKQKLCSKNLMFKNKKLLYRLENISIDDIKLYSKECGSWGSKYFNSNKYPCLIVPRNLHTNKILLVSGVITIVLDDQNKCIFFENGNGYNGKKILGYLINDTHIKAETKKEALKKYAEMQAKQKKALERSLKNGSFKWISIDDSLKGGNCLAGTQAFLEKNNLQNVGAIRSDYLLEFTNISKHFLLRAIGASEKIIKAI